MAETATSPLRTADDADTAGESKDTAPDRCGIDLLHGVVLDRTDATRVSELFKVLGDPTRVLILQALIRGEELCVRHLAEAVGMSQSSVSHHLRILRTARLIRFRRAGREVYYRPDDEHVEQLIGVCVEHLLHEAH